MNQFTNFGRQFSTKASQTFASGREKCSQASQALSNWSLGNIEIDTMTGTAADPKYHARKIIKLLGQSWIQEKNSISIVREAENISGNFGVNVGDLHGLVDTVVDGAKSGAKLATESSGKLRDAKARLDEFSAPMRALYRRIKEWVTEKMARFVELFRAAWSKINNEYVLLAIREAEQMLSFVAGAVVDIIATSITKAAPAVGYVSDGLGMATSLWTAAKNSVNFGKMEYHADHFTVVNGAPSLIMKSLERHYATRVASGVVGVYKNTATLTLRTAADGAGFGTGAIVGLVIGCLDAVFHFVDRMSERIMLRVALWQAKRAHESDYKSLTSDYGKFCEWFRTWLVLCPVLGSVVLRGVYATHPNRFIDATDRNRSNATVQIGRLVKHAGDYLNQHKNEYSLQFVSDDTKIAAKLREAYG